MLFFVRAFIGFTGIELKAGWKTYLLGETLAERTGIDVDVINAGLASWTSYESMINFELRLLDLEPDLLIMYHAVNDLHARMVWPPQAYRGDNSGRRVAAETTLIMPSPLESSAVARMLMVRTGLVRSHSDMDRFRNPAAEAYVGTDYNGQWVQRSLLSFLRLLRLPGFLFVSNDSPHHTYLLLYET